MVNDLVGLNKAIEVGFKGVSKGERPFGAAIYCGEELIAVAHNTVNSTSNPVNHAEINVISKTSKKLGEGDWKNCVIYSSCEPCPMCFSAIHWARIPKIVFSASISDAEKIGFNELKISNKKMNSLGKAGIELKRIKLVKAIDLFKEYVSKSKLFKNKLGSFY